MKIVMQTFFNEEIRRAIRSDVSFSSMIDLDQPGYKFEFPGDDLFNIFIDKVKHLSRVSMRIYMEFAPEDSVDASLFKVQCRGTLLKETKDDEAFNVLQVEKIPFRLTGSTSRVKLKDNFALSKIILPAKMVGYIDFRGEYVISKYIVDIFKSEGLTGFETRPIYNSSLQKNHDEHFLLFGSSFLPEAVRDISWRKIQASDEPQYSIHTIWGTLCYEDGLVVAQDFNRSAEGYAADFSPFWVVSDKAKKCFEKHKLKGWQFIPILVRDSTMYERYIKMWQDFFNIINTVNKIHIY